MSLENPMPGSQTPSAGAPHAPYAPYAPQQAYPTYPTYPAYPAYPPAAPYGPYPGYGYAGAPQPGYPPPTYVPPPVPVLPPVPSRAPDSPRRLRLAALIVTVVLLVATVAALALSAAAPLFVARDPGPPTGGSFQQVYNSALSDDSTNWDVDHGCVFEGGGLHATNESSATLCQFAPSTQQDYTSGGFYLTTHIAPPGAVNSLEAACVHFSSGSDTASFAIDQNGNYALLTNPPDACSPAPAFGDPPSETSALHAAGDVGNDLSMRYDAANRVLTVYVNGQQILSTGWLFGDRYTISLGTAAGDEAVYTSFGLWSAQP